MAGNSQQGLGHELMSQLKGKTPKKENVGLPIEAEPKSCPPPCVRSPLKCPLFPGQDGYCPASVLYGGDGKRCPFIKVCCPCRPPPPCPLTYDENTDPDVKHSKAFRFKPLYPVFYKKKLTSANCPLKESQLPCKQCLGGSLSKAERITGCRLLGKTCPFLNIKGMCKDKCLCDDVPKINTGPRCPFAPKCRCCPVFKCPLAKIKVCSNESSQNQDQKPETLPGNCQSLPPCAPKTSGCCCSK